MEIIEINNLLLNINFVLRGRSHVLSVQPPYLKLVGTATTFNNRSVVPMVRKYTKEKKEKEFLTYIFESISRSLCKVSS